MSGIASDANPSTPTTESRTVTTRSGYPPGTPQPPIDPPRRRSSLGFSRFFTWSSPGKTSADFPETSTMVDTPRRTPSNTSAKRMPPSVNRSTVTPGHVAQMQRLFQSGKAALRLDMAFAASPTGSIGSRLPPDKFTPSHSPAEVAQEREEIPDKVWRYSIAPQLIAASDVDVREPVPEGSPTLPDVLDLVDEDIVEPALEPLSSGFNSPIEGNTVDTHRDNAPEGFARESDDNEISEDASEHAVSLLDCEKDLEQTMTALKVCSEDENANMDLDDSPIVSHLKRMSAEPPSMVRLPSSDDHEIFLSEPAEAAAESAKVKRGLLRRLFPRRDHRASTPDQDKLPSPTEPVTYSPPCPDPTLHRLMSMGVCPDPAAHFRISPPSMLTAPMILGSPDAAFSRAQPTSGHMEGMLLPPPPPFHRATSTGSPMPFARPHTATPSPGPQWNPRSRSYYGPTPHAPLQIQHLYRPQTQNGYPTTASEHFQPGWYYAHEPSQPAERLNPMTYSFSTAAAKVVGQSAAPDLRIRDSYRTDTLTPLAKPPSRFRKTGIGALANTRGVSRYYDGPDRTNSRATRPGTSRATRTGENVQFRSSPPRAPERMVPIHQKRRRPRDLEDAQFDIQEDETAEDGSFSCTKQLDEAEEPIEVDERTRAAVRMSLYGSQTPEASQGNREGIKELSPNVTPWRKGMRQPRKKRRPSYWDGDLQQVRAGPGKEEQVRSIHPGAERQVMTSPAKEDVESMRVSVREEGHIEIEYAENRLPEAEEMGETAPEEQSLTVVDEMEVEA